MTNTLTCPQCRATIEITEALTAALRSQLHDELQAEFAPQRRQLAEQAQMLAREKAALNAQRQAVDQEIQRRLAAERERLTQDARRKATEEAAIQIKERDEQLREAAEKLRVAQQNELELRKRERALQAQKEELELTVNRRLDEERTKIRAAALQQAAQDHELKAAEQDKLITELRGQVSDMKRKIEQGPQQRQGEVLEIALENLLRQAFPTDRIEEVPKGVRGGDCLQRVISPAGLDCGTILWETKRTKNWGGDWLAKLRQDQREARAAAAILVSEALPEGVTHFDLIGEVWVCSWACAAHLARTLRAGLMNVASVRRALEGQHGKTEQVYNYLVSPHFRNRVTGVVEPLIAMQVELQTEKRALERIWAKREKQLEQAVGGMMGMYGDFQGVLGAALPEIDGLALPEPVEPLAKALPSTVV